MGHRLASTVRSGVIDMPGVFLNQIIIHFKNFQL